MKPITPEMFVTMDAERLTKVATELGTLESEESVRKALEASRSGGAKVVPPQHLQEAEDAADTRKPLEPPSSHRRFIGPVLVTAKRTFRAAFQPFINELLRTQVTFNERILHALTLLHEQVERQSRSQRRWQSELEKRLEALEHDSLRETRDGGGKKP